MNDAKTSDYAGAVLIDCNQCPWIDASPCVVMLWAYLQKNKGAIRMDSRESSVRGRQRLGSYKAPHSSEKHPGYTEYIGSELSISTFEPSFESEVSFMSDISDQFVVPFMGKATVISSSVNLINTISGAGLMALPYTIMRSGWVLGLLSMILIIIVGSISFYLLSFISDALQTFNYGALAVKLYNRHVGNLVNILIIVLTSGLLMAFTVLIRENISFFSINPEFEWINQLALIAISFVVILPLSLVKNLNSLWFTSLLSIVCLVYIMTMLLTFAILTNSPSAIEKNLVLPIEKAPPTPINISLNTVLAIASLSVTFCGHYNSLNVYKEVKEKSLTKMKHIIIIVAVVVAILNIVVGISGYMMFTDQCLPDVLLNLSEYPSANIWSKLANISIILVLVFSFPVVCFALRRAVEDAILKTEYVRRKWSTMISLIVVIFTALVGCFVNDVGMMLDLTGMLAGVPLVFIFPAVFTISFLNPRSHYNKQFSRALRLQQAIIGHGKHEKPGNKEKSRQSLDADEDAESTSVEPRRKHYNNYYMGPVQIAQERIFNNTGRLKRLHVLSWTTCILGVALLTSALGTTGFILVRSVH